MRITTNSTLDAQSLDTVFGLLANPRRRYALVALSERESPVSLAELATAVADREAATGEDESAGTADEIANELHHVHLPRLADANVVAYDDGAEEVTLARTEHVAPFLDVADDTQ